MSILNLKFFFDILAYFCRDEIRAVPVPSTRSSVGSLTPHHCSFPIAEDDFLVFQPILDELEKRISGDGNGSLWHHEIGGSGVHTKAMKFECTDYLTPEMQGQLQKIVLSSPSSDGVPRKCFRALANHYKTTVQLSSKQALAKPLLKPHRDDVNNADVSIVLGITDRCAYRGALLYISTNTKGSIWHEREGVPSRKRVIGVDVCKGMCVILRHKVEHFVSALQSGERGSLVFHMTRN